MWSKIDDSLHGNLKVRRAGDAMALWVVALSFVGQQGTDGFVPDWFVASWPNGPTHAETLVRVGLWHNASRDGDDGFEIHDYLEYNPSRKQVAATRKANAERQAEWRRNRKKKGDEVVDLADRRATGNAS